MRKLVLAVAALTIVGVVTGVTVAQSAPKSAGVVTKQTLVFTEKQTAFKFIDVAPKVGPSNRTAARPGSQPGQTPFNGTFRRLAI